VSIETQEGKELLQQLTRLVIAQSKAPQGVTQMVMQPPTRGERGIWLVVTCALVQLVMTFFLVVGFLLIWIMVKDYGHMQSALYQSVPGLRELVNKTVEANKAITEEEKQK
jgi:hypothetical protein